MPPESDMISLVFGAVSCLWVIPRLPVHKFVLKHCVCHNKIVGHADAEQPGATVSHWCWETKSAHGPTLQLSFTAQLSVEVSHKH